MNVPGRRPRPGERWWRGETEYLVKSVDELGGLVLTLPRRANFTSYYLTPATVAHLLEVGELRSFARVQPGAKS